MKDKKNKKTKDSGMTFTFKNGRLKRVKEGEASMTTMARALAAKKPFTELIDGLMTAIGQSLQKNQSRLPAEDALKLPVGAIAYILAHYYVYLQKVATVEDRKKFLQDFVTQAEAAMILFDGKTG